jgi:hypothetical protein
MTLGTHFQQNNKNPDVKKLGVIAIIPIFSANFVIFDLEISLLLC